MRIIRNTDEAGESFDRHFKEQLRNHQAAPSANLWDRVESDLDMERERTKHDHWYKAVILFLIPLTITNLFVTYKLNDYPLSSLMNSELSILSSLSGNSSEIPSPQLSGLNINGHEILITNCFDSETVSTGSNEKIFPAASSLLLSHFKKEQERPVFTASASADYLPMQKANSIGKGSISPEITALNLDGYAARLRDEMSSVRGFHFGIEGGLNSNWLLLDDKSLSPVILGSSKAKFDWGPSFGFSAGYDFSNKFGVEVEYILKSIQGYRYRENRYGKISIDGEIDLDYMQLPVMFKYKIAHKGIRSAKPRAVNFVTGIQYSRLRKAELSYNNLTLHDEGTENINNVFSRDELGLLMGIEYDLYLSSKYFFSFGARASFSSDVNTYTGANKDEPQTYNFLIGVNASFHYLVKPGNRSRK